MRTFGGTSSDVIVDIRTGLPPAENTTLTVWTGINGSPITDLQDVNGDVIEDGSVPVEPNGSYRFRVDSDARDIVWLLDSNGNWWRARSEEIDDTAAEMAQEWPETAALARTNAHALGQITRNVGDYATAAQLNGTADAAPAWQACLDTLPDRVITPFGSRFWFEGTDAAKIKSPVEIDLRGSTIFKTSDYGYYCAFVINRVSDVIIRNGYFRGHLNTGGNLCVVAGHHAENVLIDNCQMDGCQGGGHTFDLCGCDGVTFRDCTWRGFDPVSNPQHSETIQCDISYRGALSYPDDDGTYDGAHTKNVRLENCRFLPWTDPDTNISYPSPIPIGAHTFVEGQWYENITLRNVEVVDPWSDAAPGGILQNNANPAGLIHFACVKGLKIDGMKVTATNGLASVRLVMVASRSNGVMADSDFSGTYTSGDWTTPQASQDIKIRNLAAFGMGGADSTLNPLIVAVGADNAKITDIKIDMSADKAKMQIVQLYNCTDATVNVNGQNTTSVGVRLVKCQRVSVGGTFKEVMYPVSVDGSKRITVGPMVAEKGGTASPAVILQQTTTGANDFITATGINANGYTATISGTAPARYAEAGCLVAPDESTVVPILTARARQLADQAVTNSTALVDSQLSVRVDPNSFYELSGLIAYNAKAASDIGFDWTIPAGAVLGYTTDGFSSSITTSVEAIYRRWLTAGTRSRAGGDDGGALVMKPAGYIKTGATGGLVTFRFAQDTAGATATSLLTGSWLQVDKVA